MGKKEEEEEEHVRNIYDICLLTKEEDIKEEDKEEKRWCWGQKKLFSSLCFWCFCCWCS